MKIEITAKNYTIPEKLKDLLYKKLNKLDKYFNDNTAIKVLVKKEGDNFKMEITAALSNSFVRAELTNDNPYDAIDILIPKIEKQVLKYKSKLNDKLKTFNYAEAKTDETESPFKIAKIKIFDLTPMNAEDAAMEMDLSSHDFYVFLNEDTQKVNVIYRRNNGSLGLLIPNS